MAAVDLTMFDLFSCSMLAKAIGDGDGDGEKEEMSRGAEEGECMGESGKLGEAGTDWLLTFEFAVWISRQLPLTDAAGI